MSSVIKIWFFSIVLNDVLEWFQEFFFGHDFWFSENLTDDVFEFVINNDDSVAIFGVFKNLIGDRRGLFYFINVPVGKFNGVWTWVIACSMMSGRNLERANEPLSPTTKTLYALLSALTKALTYLTTPELTPPQRPLSEVTGTTSHFLGVKVCFFFWRKV